MRGDLWGWAYGRRLECTKWEGCSADADDHGRGCAKSGWEWES